MQITEVRVQLVNSGRGPLRAFCSITFDDAFVVRDLKVINTSNGVFVAMPSRKRVTRCFDCGTKNVCLARFCNECGVESPGRQDPMEEAAAERHADIAHPIHAECRERIESRVLEAFRLELERSRDPGSLSRSAADPDDRGELDDESTPAPTGSGARSSDRRVRREKDSSRSHPRRSSSPRGSPPEPPPGGERSRPGKTAPTGPASSPSIRAEPEAAEPRSVRAPWLDEERDEERDEARKDERPRTKRASDRPFGEGLRS